MSEYINNIITKANGKDKVVDFRDGLVRAGKDSYASIHQAGGGGNFPSVIKMVICDYSQGTGDRSTTVSVNLEPTLMFEFFEVCRKAVAASDGSPMLNPSYSFTVSKVNPHKKGQDGYAPVSMATVARAPFRKEGELSRYPWTLKITNGEAVMKVQSTGATTFDASTLRSKKDAYINVSDRDMFRMMRSVCRYIEVWEMGSVELIRSVTS